MKAGVLEQTTGLYDVHFQTFYRFIITDARSSRLLGFIAFCFFIF